MRSEFQRQTSELLKEAQLKAEAQGLHVTAMEWEWLLEFASGISKMERLLGSVTPTKADWESVFHSGRNRRLQGEPIQYILGTTEFYGRKFAVGPSVLIPRPETESLVEWAADIGNRQTAPRILDIGTGSGCIAVSLALEVPGSEVRAIDCSREALAVARSNASTLGASVDFERTDVLNDAIPDPPYSLIVSNPPYVPVEEMEEMQREVRDYEPHVALFAGRDPLLFYRKFAETLRTTLRSGGYIGMEIHAQFGPEVAKLFVDNGWRNVMVKQDLAGMDRFVVASVD